MAKPTKRKVSGGRVTPKGGGTVPDKTASRTGDASSDNVTKRPTRSSNRVTEKGTVPHGDAPRSSTYNNQKLGPSPTWVPVLMFSLLGLGAIFIVINYLGWLPGAPSNWYLLAGLGFILGGIITATQFR